MGNKHKRRQKALLNQPFPKKMMLEIGVFCVIVFGLSLYINFPEDQPENPDIIVYKTLGCLCAEDWVDHLKEGGLSVALYNSPLLKPVREKYHIPDGFTACHTAIVMGYYVEGHVEVEDIRRLIADKPAIAGIVLPDATVDRRGKETKSRLPDRLLQFDQAGNYQSF